MVRDDDTGDIVARTEYRIVYAGETMEKYPSGQARKAVEKAKLHGGAVFAQVVLVKDKGLVEVEGPWKQVYPSNEPATVSA